MRARDLVPGLGDGEEGGLRLHHVFQVRERGLLLIGGHRVIDLLERGLERLSVLLAARGGALQGRFGELLVFTFEAIDERAERLERVAVGLLLDGGEARLEARLVGHRVQRVLEQQLAEGLASERVVTLFEREHAGAIERVLPCGALRERLAHGEERVDAFPARLRLRDREGLGESLVGARVLLRLDLRAGACSSAGSGVLRTGAEGNGADEQQVTHGGPHSRLSVRENARKCGLADT